MKFTNKKLRDLFKKIIGENLTYRIKLFNLINHLKKINEKKFLKEYPEAKNIGKYIKNPEVCFDIGANYGVYSFYLSKKFPNSKIYSFEPYSRSFYILRKIKKRFNLQNIFPKRLALGNKNEKMKIWVHDFEDAMATISKNKGEDVVMVKLDDFVKKNKINKIDFIKIDVEGFEKNIIDGGMKTIKEFKPVILMEIVETLLKKFNSTPKEIIKMMERLGYRSLKQGEGDYLFI